MTVLFLIVTCVILKRRRMMSVLRIYGIPGPKPHIIFGNAMELRELPLIDRQKEWIKTYGKIMGYYLGAQPVVLVADPNLARAIQVKDFKNFVNKLPAQHQLDPAPYFGPSLLLSRNERWKRTRSLLSPVFSSSKLKLMTLIMEKSINKFLEEIEIKSKNGKHFDFYALCVELTNDLQLRTIFGIEDKVIIEKIAKNIRNYTRPKFNKVLSLMQICFPSLYPLRKLEDTIHYYFKLSPIKFLWNITSKFINFRKEHPDLRRNDLLQAMLDSKQSTNEIDAKSDNSLTAGYKQEYENLENEMNKSIDIINLSDDEIIANCLLFYGAASETSSSALGFIAHHLITYPDVQEKIREEVMNLLEKKGNLDFNAINSLEYMDWVIKETLRLYPPLVTATTRVSKHDYKYANITIPKGALILFAINQLHRDSDYWEEPDKFDPLRFSPAQKLETFDSSWQPFGDGPRNCIGMRFAYLEIKLTLAKLLVQYRLEAEFTPSMKPLSTKCRLMFMFPDQGVFLKVSKIH